MKFLFTTLSQVSRQNLHRNNCFILVTEDPVNTSDSVASSAAKHQNLGLDQNGFGDKATE